MTPAKFYKQSVFDHASIMIAVSIFENECTNVRAFDTLLDYICKKYDNIDLSMPDNKLRKIYFNFKTQLSSQEKDWENFQSHHRPFGFVCISEFKTGNSLRKLLDYYLSEKEKILNSFYESRLIFICDENTKVYERCIRNYFNNNGDILTSGDINFVKQANINDISIAEELRFIQDSFVQNEIIWYQYFSNDAKSVVTTSISNSSPNNVDRKIYNEGSFELDINNFLKTVFEKLSSALACREIYLSSKVEQNKTRQGNNEGSSDNGSVLSLDDGEFNLLDPVDQDTKKFLEENRFSKGNRSRQYFGRLNKQTADFSLLCGNYFESYYYYQQAIFNLKKINDQLWLAGAEEGLCCSWIMYNSLDTSQSFDKNLVTSLHEKCKFKYLNQSRSDQTMSPILSSSDQSDFSFLKKLTFNDSLKNFSEIHNLEDLYEKYRTCITHYKKILKNKVKNLYPIHLDSIIKASRFFIDQHRFLDAAYFLTMIKNDTLHLHDDEVEYHNSLSQLYCQMGFSRKSALHKYKEVFLLSTRVNSLTNSNKQYVNEQKMNMLIAILNDLNVKSNVLFMNKNTDNLICLLSDESNATEPNEGFQSIQMLITIELFDVCRILNSPTNILLGLGITILDNWYMQISKNNFDKLIEDINSISKSGTVKDRISNRNVSVFNLPRLSSILLCRLPEYLIPRNPKKKEHNSVFLYTPIKTGAQYNQYMNLEPVIWICGEECEILLYFDNLTDTPLQLYEVSFLLNNMDTDIQTWVPSETSSIHYLTENKKKIRCHFVIVPHLQNIAVGTYRIVNVSYKLMSIQNITFHPHNTIKNMLFKSTKTPEIKLYPMMPQLRIISSINEKSNNSIHKPSEQMPSTNVVYSSNLTLYENEILEFSLFLTNESKELNIDQIVCLLDEFEINNASNILISRFSAQEFSNQKRCFHRLLSFSPNNLKKCLPIKSISSLKDSTALDSSNPTVPTDAILKFRIDTTNHEFCHELFEKSSLNFYKWLDILWRGQLKITFKYWSYKSNIDFSETSPSTSDIDDVVIIKKDETSLSSMYRESVCIFNCQLIAGLHVINYRIDEELNLSITLMNFTDNKMNIEIFWNNTKIQKNNIVIPSRFDQSNQLKVSNLDHRNSSTELFSHIYHLKIFSDVLQFKLLMLSGKIGCELDLIKYIQENLKISWIMKDKSIDKLRQGFVNLNWCFCYFSKDLYQNILSDEVSLGHELIFSSVDLIRIWMSENVKLEITFWNKNGTPALFENTENTYNILDGIIYKIRCIFEEQWPSFISDEIISSIRLLPQVVPDQILGNSLSSLIHEKGQLENFVFGGNTMLLLQKESVPVTEMNGYVMFLQSGTYSLSCNLSIHTFYHNLQSEFSILVESDKYVFRII